MNRSGISRLETRSTRANKDEVVKRVMLSVERVRKWEKKWVDSGIDGCTLKTFKWVPVVTKEEIKTVKNIAKDNVSDVSSNTSSPLPMEENNLNSGNIPSQVKDGEHFNRSKLAIDNEGEDSSTALSVASEDSSALMYHLGMNVANDNNDSRQSFDSETSTENNSNKAPLSSTTVLDTKPESGASFKGIATKLKPTSNEEQTSDEPPLKRLKDDKTQ